MSSPPVHDFSACADGFGRLRFFRARGLLAGFLVLAASFSFSPLALFGEAQFPIRQLPGQRGPGLFRTTGAPLGQEPAGPAHPAVARVIAPEKDAVSYGSGTLIDARGQFGLVVTNWHVIRDATGPISVQFPGGFKSAAQVVKTDKDWDLAALSIQRPPATPVSITATAPQPGDQLTIGGYGPGEWRTATGRCTQYLAPGFEFPHEMVELSAEARQGDSGGPIFNQQGELAGVLFGSGPGYTSGSYGGRVLQFLATVVPGGLPGNDQAQQPIAGSGPNLSAPPSAYADAAKAFASNEFSPPPRTSTDTAKRSGTFPDAEGGPLTPAGESPGQRLLTPPPPNRLADRFNDESTEKNGAEIDARVAVAPQMFSAASPSAYVADRIAANSSASSGLVPLTPRSPSSTASPSQAAPEQLLASTWRQFGGTTVYDQTKAVLAIIGVLAVVIVFLRTGRDREPEHHED